MAHSKNLMNKSRTTGRKLLLVLTMVAVVAAGCSSTSESTTTASGSVPDTTAPATPTTAENGTTETTASTEIDREGMTSAEIAVTQAQQYSGTTLDVMWAGSLHAQNELEFTVPLWESLTGITVNILDTETADMLNNAVTDHFAGAGSYDVIHSPPTVLPDLVESGAIENLDPYIEKYMNPADLNDFHPLYEEIGRYEGSQWALFDDGDVVFLYYRTDVFEDPQLQADYLAEYGTEFVVPTTWEELSTVAQFITDERAPEMYGYMADRGRSNRLFRTQFLTNGGEFFDPANDMRAEINSPAGVLTATQMLEQNAAAPPGIESGDAGNVLSNFLSGQAAMGAFWPPLGRWAHGVGFGEEGLDFVPESVVGDVTGYALLPGELSPHVGGFQLSLSSDSDSKDAAYLFMQWVTSPDISLERILQPTTLRDPYRLSHFDSAEYASLFPGAAEYLETVREAADTAVTEFAVPGSSEYQDALDAALSDIFAGADPQTALDAAADEWNRITDRLGVEAALAAWLVYLESVGSSPDTTVRALGLD